MEERSPRLHREEDIARLEVIERTKPLGSTSEEMDQVLTVLAGLPTAAGGDRVRRESLRRRLDEVSPTPRRPAED